MKIKPVYNFSPDPILPISNPYYHYLMERRPTRKDRRKKNKNQ